MIYTCEKCHYTFVNVIVGSYKLYCPDCGSAHIRPASEFEKERYEEEQAELALIYNGDVV